MQLSLEELFEFPDKLKDEKDLAILRARSAFVTSLVKELDKIKAANAGTPYVAAINDVLNLVEAVCREKLLP